MRNYLNLFCVLAVTVAMGMGCGYLGDSGSSQPTNANGSMSDRAIDTAIGRSNVGVPACDGVLDAIELELNNPDDNFVVKAAKATALNRIKDNIRKEIERNPNKEELAKTCTEFRRQFDNYKSSQQPQSPER